MEIPFIKMQGAGNDYVYLDMLSTAYEVDFPDLARRISSRHFGVGGDGLVLILPAGGGTRDEDAGDEDCVMRMFNADGSEAEMCGNAIRCVGKYLYDSGRTAGQELTIRTLGGKKHLRVSAKDGSGKAASLRVDMGEPILRGKDIPVSVDREPVLGVELLGYTGTAVSMGNPHFVIFVDEITDRQVLEHGPELEKDSFFPKKANIEFARVSGPSEIVMRVWERGTGETLACGTGACATAVAGVLNGLTGREVDLRLLGGILHIEWSLMDNRVYMTGPAVEVFRGVYHYAG
jgi:diaminopimelate epimerase